VVGFGKMNRKNTGHRACLLYLNDFFDQFPGLIELLLHVVEGISSFKCQMESNGHDSRILSSAYESYGDQR
jgi:hypothetical protein